jgi:hypothetical protein
MYVQVSSDIVIAAPQFRLSMIHHSINVLLPITFLGQHSVDVLYPASWKSLETFKLNDAALGCSTTR